MRMYTKCNRCSNGSCKGDVKRGKKGEPITNAHGSMMKSPCLGFKPLTPMKISLLEAATSKPDWIGNLQTVLSGLDMIINPMDKYPYFKLARL